MCYTACRLAAQTVEYTLPGFQGIKRRIIYMASQPHKNIFILLIIIMYQISPDLH